MKKWWIFLFIGCFFLFSVPAQAQIGKMIDRFLEGVEQRISSEYLQVVQLEASPDPFQDGDSVIFRATIANSYQYAGRATLAVRDRYQVISEARSIVLNPGNNLVDFPAATYQSSGRDRCFTIEAEKTDRTWTAINAVKQFCANKTQSGWTMSDAVAGPLYIEDIEIYPDPASSVQEITFRVKLRNDGRPLRGDIQISDQDQVVAALQNTIIQRGLGEYQLLPVKYRFQRVDACFTVSVASGQTAYPVEASGKKFCAYPTGWTLKPAMRWHKKGERVK